MHDTVVDPVPINHRLSPHIEGQLVTKALIGAIIGSPFIGSRSFCCGITQNDPHDLTQLLLARSH